MDPDKDLARPGIPVLFSGRRRMELRPILGSSLSLEMGIIFVNKLNFGKRKTKKKFVNDDVVQRKTLDERTNVQRNEKTIVFLNLKI